MAEAREGFDNVSDQGVGRRPRVFISFVAIEARDIYNVMVSTLEQAGYDVFDPFSMPQPSKESMQDHVRRSDIFVPVMTAGYFESPWCRVEAAAALEANMLCVPVNNADTFPVAPGSALMQMREGETHVELRRFIFKNQIRPVVQCTRQAKVMLEFVEWLATVFHLWLVQNPQCRTAQEVAPSRKRGPIAAATTGLDRILGRRAPPQTALMSHPRAMLVGGVVTLSVAIMLTTRCWTPKLTKATGFGQPAAAATDATVPPAVPVDQLDRDHLFAAAGAGWGIFGDKDSHGFTPAASEPTRDTANEQFGNKTTRTPLGSSWSLDDVWGRHVPGTTPYFAGRDIELGVLRVALQHHSAGAIVAYGGAGKTQLMLHHVMTSFADYPSGVFWVAGTELAVGLAELARHLSHSDVSSDDLSTSTSAALGALKKRQGQWLLCIDSADDRKILQTFASAANRAGVFGRRASGRLLVTSRVGDVSIWHDLGVRTGGNTPSLLTLRPLRIDTAGEVLYRRMRGLPSDEFSHSDVMGSIGNLSAIESAALAALVGSTHDYSLGGLPLALDQAGAYMATFDKTFNEYLELLRAHAEAQVAISLPPAHPCSGTGPEAVRRCTVHTTWELNVAQLEPDSMRILYEIAQFAANDISERLLRELAAQVENVTVNDATAKIAFDELVVMPLVNGASLLGHDGNLGEGRSPGRDRSYSIHGMIRSFVLARSSSMSGLPAPANGRVAPSALFAVFAAVGDVSHLGCLRGCPRALRRNVALLPHVESAMAHSPKAAALPERSDLSSWASRTCRCTSRFLSAVQHAKLALALQVQLHEGDDDAHAASLCAVGVALHEKGHIAEFDEALTFLNSSHNMLRRIYGESADHIHVAVTLHEIGNVLLSQRKTENALVAFKASLAMRLRLYSNTADSRASSEQLSAAESVLSIGNVMHSLNSHESALKLYQLSLAEFTRTNSGDSVVLAEIYSRMGTVYVSRGAYSRRLAAAKNQYIIALGYFRESLSMQKRMYGNNANHLSIARTLLEMGTALFMVSTSADALRHFHQSLAMLFRIYGSKVDSRDAVSAHHWIGYVLTLHDEHAEALKHFQAGMAILDRSFGENADFDLAMLLGRVGVSLRRQHSLKGTDECRAGLAMYNRLFVEGVGTVSSFKLRALVSAVGASGGSRADACDVLENYELKMSTVASIVPTLCDDECNASSLALIAHTFSVSGNHERALAYYNASLALCLRVEIFAAIGFGVWRGVPESCFFVDTDGHPQYQVLCGRAFTSLTPWRQAMWHFGNLSPSQSNVIILTVYLVFLASALITGFLSCEEAGDSFAVPPRDKVCKIQTQPVGEGDLSEWLPDLE